MSDSRPVIKKVVPPAAIPGGDFEIRGAGLAPAGERQPIVRFGETPGRLVVGGSSRIVVRVPDEAVDNELSVECAGVKSKAFPCSLGLSIAEGLHPVANPAVDLAGNIFTTRSGTRGERVPVSVFKIDTNFNVRPFVSEIINPTGMLVDPEGALLISSRNNGTIYAVTPGGQVEVYAEGMGVATGLAMDADGNLFVGDRTGTIFKIARDRQIFVFATVEPSISAYHLAFGPDGNLYVSGPTTSSFDNVYKVDPKGDVEVYHRGLGRPQGLAFDEEGRLYVAASKGGRKGVFRIYEDGRAEQVVSGPGVVGLAFLPTGEMILATGSNLYRTPTEGWIDD
ncbi:MAG: gluconolaconase [Acidobacteria bacterium]|nr:gluconolaconase [Acidobacteriota bacterium]